MDASRPRLKVEDSAANSTPNKQNTGPCQLLTTPVPVAPAAIAIVTAPNSPSLVWSLRTQSLEIASGVMTWDW